MDNPVRPCSDRTSGDPWDGSEGRICWLRSLYYESCMSGRNGQELLSTWVAADVAARFKAQARATDGGASAALRRLVTEAVGEAAPAAPASPAGHQVTVRLRDAERLALLAAASARGTSPANWLRSLAIVHLAGRPQWSTSEAEALREIFVELRRIGNTVNQIARTLDAADPSGGQSLAQGDAAKEAAELIRAEMRRVGAVLTGNLDYWGLPEEGRPVVGRGRAKQDRDLSSAEAERHRLRPRKRPARFKGG